MRSAKVALQLFFTNVYSTDSLFYYKTTIRECVGVWTGGWLSGDYKANLSLADLATGDCCLTVGWALQFLLCSCFLLGLLTLLSYKRVETVKRSLIWSILLSLWLFDDRAILSKGKMLVYGNTIEQAGTVDILIKTVWYSKNLKIASKLH